MKIPITSCTLTVLNNLKGLWLLSEDKIIIIKDFKSEKIKPEVQPELPVNTSFFKRKSKPVDVSEKLYVTDLTLIGYNPDLKIVGTYNEDCCTRLIIKENDINNTLSLVDYRKAWLRFEEQLEALKKSEESNN